MQKEGSSLRCVALVLDAPSLPQHITASQTCENLQIITEARAREHQYYTRDNGSYSILFLCVKQKNILIYINNFNHMSHYAAFIEGAASHGCIHFYCGSSQLRRNCTLPI